MTITWADDFLAIPSAVAENAAIRAKMLDLIRHRRVQGKVTEGGARLDALRNILSSLTNGDISFDAAVALAERDLCPETSTYGDDRRVFCRKWAERLMRTQFSRFYNQAVLEYLNDCGETEVFVPHSRNEDLDSQCSELLADRTHSITMLHSRLIENYEHGSWGTDPKIPDRPHCTHVVRPMPRFQDPN